jgi:hypothetical protein
MIEFIWNGHSYKVGMEAYDKNRIVLPDGILLEAEEWLESHPPQPIELHQIRHNFLGLGQDEIAKKLDAVPATIVI